MAYPACIFNKGSGAPGSEWTKKSAAEGSAAATGDVHDSDKAAAATSVVGSRLQPAKNCPTAIFLRNRENLFGPQGSSRSGRPSDKQDQMGGLVEKK